MIKTQVGRMSILCNSEEEAIKIVMAIFPGAAPGATEYSERTPVIGNRDSVQVWTVWVDGPNGSLVQTEAARIVSGLGPDALPGGPSTLEELAATIPLCVVGSHLLCEETP